MKNTFYVLILFLGVTITGCEPMEDIHDEIDEKISNIEGSLDYTLTEEDYTDNLSLSNTSFDSDDDARELIPVLLSNNFPALGENSSVNVTYNIYDPIRVTEYTVTSEDYEALELAGNYFTGMGAVTSFLEYNFPQAEQGDYVELTYRTLADEISYSISNDDFDLIGEQLEGTYPDPASSASNYNNFDRREGNDAYWSDEMILEAINVVLSENFEGVEGQKYNVNYAVYDGNSGTESMTVQFNGNNYVAVGGTAVELSNADFDLIGEELAETYPGPAESAANYNNFDRREGEDAYWSEEMILEALNVVLEENYPSATEDEQFEVSYTIYNGSAGTEIMSVVRSGDEYIVDENTSVSTIEETTVFAYTNGSWNTPLMIQEEDYIEMGQSYLNFDDQDEAVYKLAIFLENRFPYAQEGDFVAVGYTYTFFEDDARQYETRYANFVFEDGEFEYVESVVEKTLQFSHSGNQWEPDNTIRYTLVEADYDYIAEEFADVSGYEAAANNLAQYGNFNLNNWDEEMILEALKVFLNNFDASAEVGQKYILSYEVYPGYIMTQMNLIKDESGAWVLNE